MTRKFLTSVAAVTAGIFISAGSYAAELTSEKTVLDSGLTVLVAEMPTSPMVSVYGLVKSGSATEGEYLGSGVSHFLEHMLFKGTTSRGVGEIAAQIQAVGGTMNAATSFDYTIYIINVPYESFDLALDILADVLMNASFDAQELEKEREVIFGEMRLHHDNPDRRLSEMVFGTAYQRHPYKHPIIGYENLFAALSRTDVVSYYEKHYVPENTIISIAGNVKVADAMPKVKQVFADFSRSRGHTRHLPAEPQQISERDYTEHYPTPVARVSMAFGSVPLLHQDLYALDVLAGILGDGQSARLYQSLYQNKELVYGVSAGNFTPMDRGIFEINMTLPVDNVDKAIADVWREIDLVKKKGVSAKELGKSRQMTLSQFVMGTQTASQVAYHQATDEAFAGDFAFSRKYIDGIHAVTNHDIKRVANMYLKRSNCSTVRLLPETEESKQVLQESAPLDASVEKIVLSNGLTLLLKEDKTFPVVSASVALQGGLRQETERNNGIFNLLSLVWVKGTASKSSKQLAEWIESKGMSLSSFSGRNSFGLSLQMLSSDVDSGLDLLADLIQRPAFDLSEVEKVKTLIASAIDQRQDSIFQMAARELRQLLFESHPLRLDQEGTKESLASLTEKDLKKFYQDFVVPSNMVIAVYGDIDKQAVQDTLRKRLEALKGEQPKLIETAEKQLSESRSKDVVLDKKQAVVIIGFHGPAIKSSDRYPVEVMAAVLGSSFSGRLFNAVREELGQAYTVGGSYVPVMDAGMIYFYALTSPDSREQVLSVIKREISRLSDEQVGQQELDDIKAYLKGTHKAGLETQSAQAFTNALDEIYGLGFAYDASYDKLIDNVTPEDIQRLAREYLNLNRAATVLTRSKVE